MVRVKLCKGCSNIYPETEEYFYKNTARGILYFKYRCKMCCRKSRRDKHFRNRKMTNEAISRRINEMLLPFKLKKCGTCNRILPLKDFYKKRPNSYHDKCTMCWDKYIQKHLKNDRDTLGKKYIVNDLLGLHVNEVSSEIIEAKRQQIKLHRTIKTLNK